ncbi:SMI1/KNR4 family protein [bacterium]|nr:SMI1/KNR4 family protein [bacterium]
MKAETWLAIEAKLAKHSVTKAKPVAYDEIGAVAKFCGFELPEDYREFVHRYGGAIVGPLPIIGLRQAPAMAREETSAIEVTQHFRKQGWRGVNEWLVISIDHAGNPIGLDKDGKVWIFDHDFGVVETIAPTFEEFLRKRCLKLE